MKKLILCVFVLGAVMVGHLLYLYHHREFGPEDFRHTFVLGLETADAPDEALKSQAREALHQKYTYLGKGTQMTVFESQDHQYVIKFFNPRDVIKSSWFPKKWSRMSSLRWISRTYFKKKERLLKFFNRYAMAFQDLREESGLVYVHLNKSTCLSQRLHLIDKEGRPHNIELDAYPFVLQKKVELVDAHLHKLLTKGEISAAQQCIVQIYDLFLSRAKKGYTDRIQTLKKNYGFVDGRAVQLDMGRIRKDSDVQSMPLKEMERIVSNIIPSLTKSYPQLAPVLKDCLENDI